MATMTTPLLPTLPGRYYADPMVYAAEQARIFSALWVCAGHASRIAAAGDYFTLDLGEENVLVTRGKDGDIRAFLNVCRHRGARVCTDACGTGRNAFQCCYHAWTYGLDGRLIGAPNMRGEALFDFRDWGLLPVACETWHGLIWLNLADNPAPLRDQLDPAVLTRFGEFDTFNRYAMSDLRVARTITYDVHANWKLTVENFMECYHCGPMHPELCDLLPGFRGGTAYQQGRGTEFAAGVDALTFDGAASRSPFPGLNEDDARKYYGIVPLPNVFLSLLPDHVVVHTLFPQAANRTRIVCDWLFHPDAIAAPTFDPSDVVDVFDLVNKQDWEACELVQQNMRSKAYRDGGVFVPLERHIFAFNTFVREKLEH